MRYTVGVAVYAPPPLSRCLCRRCVLFPQGRCVKSELHGADGTAPQPPQYEHHHDAVLPAFLARATATPPPTVPKRSPRSQTTPTTRLSYTGAVGAVPPSPPA